MIEVLALSLAWLVLTTPLSILVGKCISVGQAGETARHAVITTEPATTAAELHAHTIHAEDESAASIAEVSFAQARVAIPAQRKPAIPATHVS